MIGTYFLSHRLPLALAALREGHEVIVATRVGSQGQEILDAGFRLIPLEYLKCETRSFDDLRAIRELQTIYRRENPDIVHHVALKPILYGNRRIGITAENRECICWARISCIL
jgi:Glycosyl transferase 4-like